MTREEAIANLEMISVAFVEPVTKEQRKLIDDTFDMAIKALEQEPCDHYTEGYFKGYDDGQKGKLEQEPCEDAISRQAAIEGLASIAKTKAKSDAQKSMMGRMMFFVEQLPSVSTEKTGRWIAQDIHNCHTDFKCSECGYIHSFMHLYGEPTADYTYCPNCGAKMGVEE